MGIPCILYAAKSTEDRHGSIPDQLHDCHAAVEGLGTHHVVATYKDEAVSAFSRDRGEGLVDAMQHAEDLAQEFGAAELWAQHSDRLARGDGRSARHVVEIGLWALKRDVRVRTIQDPDTFRDLLYAVVTGQRNHEDSRRKSLAVSAGHRRAAERGVHTGPRPDGYRVVVDVDEKGGITKRLEFDPERQEMIELIFRRALRRRSTGSIARALNDAGWRTRPNRRGADPRTWTPNSVHAILKNPRYAGLSTYKGEVVSKAHWPAYITESQHHRITLWLSERRQPLRHRSLETYLLAGLARCGYCGGPIQQHTGRERKDGTWSRRYVCAGQYGDRCADRCEAPRIDADLAEAAFVAAMPVLFAEDEAIATPAGEPNVAQSWTQAAERERLIAAARVGDEQAVDRALEQLLDRAHPENAVARQMAITTRRARQREVIAEFREWVKTGVGDRSDVARAEALRLNAVLRTWLSHVTLGISAQELSIAVQHRPSAIQPARQTTVRLLRREWQRYSPAAHRSEPHIRWSDEAIVGALHRWVEQHGCAPRAIDWSHGGFEHPKSATVGKHFGSWQKALRAARVSRHPQTTRFWRDAEIIRALQSWTRMHGRPPRASEWTCGTRYRPTRSTVYNHFGGWGLALIAAGIRR